MCTTISDLDRSSSVPKFVRVKASVRSVVPVLVGCTAPLLHCLVVSLEDVVTLAIPVLVTAVVLGVKESIDPLTLYTE